MIIDFHCHVGKDSSDEEYEHLNLEELKRSMDKWGVDKAVVFPFNGDDESLIEESLEILEKSKEADWIVPLLRINPKSLSKDELSGLLDKGFKGIKLHPRAQDFDLDDEKYFWVYEMCVDRELPVLFHSSVKDSTSKPEKILSIAERFPDLKVVMAHFFGNDFSIMKIAKDYPNLYVDTSMNSGTMKRLQTVNKYGFKNMVFASDIPYDSQGVALLKIREAGFSEENEDLILGGNAAKILGLIPEMVVEKRERGEGDGK
ncbi:hypothetical protein CMI38_01515 [Candidatus Pacearchaeota archaeon]|jgi:hypothetical protein|nr:hypothetical protein [Candidatus Pacearchaeota archaeon]|tara:strand:- start:9382 stop:10158 length:777 start_codon:yes stop_codon:yes gene_type:complete